MPTKNIFDAARQGDVAKLQEHLNSKPDLAVLSEYGFTALQYAAMGSNSLEKSVTLEILKLLIEAGSPLETRSKDGRTALYLLAEFSPDVNAIQLLIDAGANADQTCNYGNHIVENAMMPEVQKLLSELTGFAIPPPEEPRPATVKMNAAAWKKAKTDLDAICNELRNAGLIVLQNAGTTQDDGFSDCSEKFHTHPDKNSVIGFCFYTGQDQSRAKRSCELPLAIWGAPAGGKTETVNVGKLVIAAFEKYGIKIIWNGKSSMRPSAYLHKYSE